MFLSIQYPQTKVCPQFMPEDGYFYFYETIQATHTMIKRTSVQRLAYCVIHILVCNLGPNSKDTSFWEKS